MWHAHVADRRQRFLSKGQLRSATSSLVPQGDLRQWDLGATATAEVGAPSSEHENDRGDDENSNPVAAATSQQKQEEPIDLQAGRKKKARMSFLDDDDDDEDDDYEGDDGSECSDD